eukprot:4539871-Pyramimonas_sp.AAC.1
MRHSYVQSRVGTSNGRGVIAREVSEGDDVNYEPMQDVGLGPPSVGNGRATGMVLSLIHISEPTRPEPI